MFESKSNVAAEFDFRNLGIRVQSVWWLVVTEGSGAGTVGFCRGGGSWWWRRGTRIKWVVIVEGLEKGEYKRVFLESYFLQPVTYTSYYKLFLLHQ